MIIVTGGAGFIGSALVWALNQRGAKDIVIVDDVDHARKERNIAPLKYERRVGIKEWHEQLLAGDWNNKGVKAIIHLGACSDTTETDWPYLLDNNVEYTKDIMRWCQESGVRCLYASSAATYGDGRQGFSDSHDLFDKLQPLNLYGRSKLLVDIWARDGGYLQQVVGLRYFNVFGPNEWHKEAMRSVINKKFEELQKSGAVSLFKSDHPDYADGEQERDFLYVKDAVAATLHFLDQSHLTGVFNIGSGHAQTWQEIIVAMFKTLKKIPTITYIPLPEKLKGKYQYHTKADITKLCDSGYNKPFMALPLAVDDYLSNYLVPDLHLGE